MMKLAVLVLFFGVAAANHASFVSSQKAIIPHHSFHGYGNGVSSRYFEKVETGLGLHRPLGYYGGLGYDGYNNFALGYGRLGLGNGPLGLGYGIHGNGKLGLGSRLHGNGKHGLGYERLGYGRLGLVSGYNGYLL